jgi:sec-independent protein translocase protein TatA
MVTIVFGVGKLPQVGGALGKGIREFRKGKAGAIDTIIGSEEMPPDSDKQLPTSES